MKKTLFSLIFGFLFSIATIGVSYAVPPPPYSIGGTVHVNGTQLLNATDTGYTFVVTKQNGDAYVPAAQDTNGLSAANIYLLNIPIFNNPDQLGGANPGDTAVFHVYYNATELTVTSPPGGIIIVGASGGTPTTVNIVATLDSDGDSIADNLDNCPSMVNANQSNNDGDALGDVCDPDDDNDTVLDGADNCPLIPNADQADNDGEGSGNVCDTDDDNDSVLDGSDAAPLNPSICRDTDADTCDDCSQNPTTGGSPTPWSLYIPSAANDGTDNDTDGLCNTGDPDDDNDGVLDAVDSNDNNPNVCNDTDNDTCDDCTNGTDNPANDGTDTDSDGMCNTGDTDDDNDGALDVNDTDDNNPNVCNDTDNDTCDDCTNGTDNPANDGTDTDSDGMCNTGDPDDDNDGALDVNDTDDNNPNVCNDTDNDTCDDCINGTDNPANDGTDTDSDGICNTGDSDDDNDGALDVNDTDDNNPNVCNDTDNDTCDDCTNGTDNPANDGTDTDSDGMCNTGDTDDDADGFSDANEITCGSDPLNAGSMPADFDHDGLCDNGVDPDDDNDGALDTNDTNDNNANICNDSDNDTCDDCTSGTANPANDGTDNDSDGACNAGDTDDDNDGALDTNDSNDNNANICNDSDNDTCDDCTNGTDNQANDGTDTDNDGACNTGDTDDDGDGFSDAHESTCGSNPLLIGSVPADFDHDGLCDNGVDTDDDNDGALDTNDTNDNNANICNDSDNDTCDDCTNGTDNPANDGTDNDSDGLCNTGDTDDDNDGALDANDSNDNNANICNDSDNDTCDDCTSGTDNQANDGTDSDSDGLCNTGDTDDDNDGALDANDSNDNNPNICNDTDGDSCDDCVNGTDNQANDGTDSDSDGLCNTGDTDDDNDGALDVNDTDDNNPNVCSDTDGDSCNDCSSGTYSPANDGTDANSDGQCETDFGDAPDPAYPSANHIAFAEEWLGADVDGEAGSDQINNDEHDDGVLFVFNEQNKLSRIEVTVSVDNYADAIRYDSAAAGKRLYLNAWIDSNNNGSWADAGDKVIGTDSGKIYLGRPTDLFTIDPVAEAWTDGAMTYVFNLASPIDWPVGSYARVRLAYGEDVGITGTAQYGEVEDYLNPILASYAVVAATGGNCDVENPESELNGTTVDIPAGALSGDTTITIEEVQNAGDLPPTPPGGIAVLADFGPDGTVFSSPVTITIPHDASLVHGSSPQVYFWDDSLPIPAWSSVGITDIVLDETSNPHLVSFKVSHFTTFGSDLGTAPAPSGNNDSGSGSGGCFIATAAYGSYLDKNVMVLREFRDKHLLTNMIGKSFVRFYYAFSPPVADYIAGHKVLKIATRLMLTPVVYGVKYPQLILLSFGFVAVGIFWSRKKKTTKE